MSKLFASGGGLPPSLSVGKTMQRDTGLPLTFNKADYSMSVSAYESIQSISSYSAISLQLFQSIGAPSP